MGHEEDGRSEAGVGGRHSLKTREAHCLSWCAKSHTAADGLSYTWGTFVVSSQEASGMKIAQCSSAHGKYSSEQKSIGCFIFPFAPSRLFIPLPPF